MQWTVYRRSHWTAIASVEILCPPVVFQGSTPGFNVNPRARRRIRNPLRRAVVRDSTARRLGSSNGETPHGRLREAVAFWAIMSMPSVIFPPGLWVALIQFGRLILARCAGTPVMWLIASSQLRLISVRDRLATQSAQNINDI